MKLDKLGKSGKGILATAPKWADGNNSKGSCQSYELDGNDNDLLFVLELQIFLIPTNFVPFKIPKYEGKGNPEKHLNKYEM